MAAEGIEAPEELAAGKYLSPPPLAQWLGSYKVERTLREIYFELGVALSSQRDAQADAQAIEAFQHARDAEGETPQAAEILFQLAHSHERLGKREPAFKTYLEALLEAPQHIRFVLPHLYVELRILPDMARLHGSWITGEWANNIAKADLEPGSRLAVQLLLVQVNLYRANYAEALALFEQAVEQARQVNPALLHIAVGEQAIGQDRQAEFKTILETAADEQTRQADPTLLEKAVSGQAGPAEQRTMVALLTDKKGGKQARPTEPQTMVDAIASMVKAGLLSPLPAALESDGNAYLALGQLYYVLGRFGEAAAQVERALNLELGDESSYPTAPALRLKAEALEAEGKLPQAAASFYEAGRQFDWRNEPAEAARLLERAQRLNPDHVPTYWHWADALRGLAWQKGGYPPADGDLLAQALDVWERGRAIEAPTPEFAWAYLTRALCLTSRVYFEPDQDSLWWQAIVNVEQALLLGRDDAYTWVLLASCHRPLDQAAVALWAIERALEPGTEYSPALSERASLLANIGAEDAMQALDRYQASLGAPDAWSDAVRGYWLGMQEKYDEALARLDKAVEADQLGSDVWVRSTRGRVHRLAGHIDQALADFRWIWEKTRPGEMLGDPTNQSHRGWAAYQLGYYEEAAGIFQALLDSEAESPFDVRFNLALCSLALGQAAEAEQWFEAALERLRHRRQLTDALQDLAELKDRLKAQAAHKAGGETIQKCIARLRAKDQTFRPAYDEQAALRELQAVLERHSARPGEWPWLAAQASLAHLHTWAGRWGEAARLYQGLIEHSQRLPEARLGLENAINELDALVTHHLQAGQPDQALQGIEQLLGLEPILADTHKQASLYGRQGCAYLCRDAPAQARPHFARAIELYRQAGQAEPGQALASACRAVLPNIQRYWKLHDEWLVMASQTSTGESLRHDLQAASQALATYLDDIYHLSARAEQSRHLLPVVAPIALALAPSLVPDKAGAEWPLIQTYLPEMRERIRSGMGINVPGVQINTDESLPPDSYVIQLDQVPLASGSLPAGEVVYGLAPAASLQALGVPRQALRDEIPHPLTGQPGCWLDAQHAGVVENNDIEVWHERLTFMVYHLESVLQRNLADFVGVQEVEALLEEWGQSESGAALVGAALHGQAARLRFVQVLQALLKENVPITAWQDILRAVQTVQDESVDEIVRAVRLRLKIYLPGNKLAMKRIYLPPEIEQSLVGQLSRQGGKTFLAIPPQPAQQLLSALDELIGPSHEQVVLVTRSEELRPFVRRLVEADWPGLAVSSQAELLLPDNVAATIQAALDKLPPDSQEARTIQSLLETFRTLLESSPAQAQEVLEKIQVLLEELAPAGQQVLSETETMFRDLLVQEQGPQPDEKEDWLKLLGKLLLSGE